MTRLAASRRKAAGLAAACAAGLLVSACTGFEHISRNYVAQPAQVVTIGCNEPYEVYDNRQRRRLLVVSNGLREVLGCELGTAVVLRDPKADRAERFRTAARTYLDETVREDCRITGEMVFSDIQTEFTYSCDAPVEPRNARVPRLPGRTR